MMKETIDIPNERAGLNLWGWSPEWDAGARNLLQPGQVAGRVTAVFREKYLIQLPDGERMGEMTGRFRHTASSAAALPAAGDWVVALPAGPDLALIHGLFPRRNLLSRKEAGREVREQVLAANVDVVFVTTAFDEDFNVRRIERYAVMARQAGMEPVVLINKGDLAAADDPRMADAREVNPGGSVHRVSARSGEGLEIVKFYLLEGKTGIFLGSSGVGKSTMLNALLGADIQKTKPIRISDGKGRHATTARQMFLLPGGGLVIDTPGLREIQLWADDSALADAFSDIAALARLCRYADCRHEAETDCAVKKAVEMGDLAADRYAGYLKLQKELAYLQRKIDPFEQAEHKRQWKTIHKTAKALYKRRERNEN